MVGILGDLDTPGSNKPNLPVVQLADLSIKSHDHTAPNSAAIPVIRAVLDPSTETVAVAAEAKTAFSDGTAKSDVVVSFFVNGSHVADVRTNEYGVAFLNQSIPVSHFRLNSCMQEMTARIPGFAREALARIIVDEKAIQITEVSHSWRYTGEASGNLYGDGRLFPYAYSQGLRFTISARPNGPVRFSLEGIVLLLQQRTPDGNWYIHGSAGLDRNGRCEIVLPSYYYHHQHYPRSRGIRPAENLYEVYETDLQIWPKDWPERAVSGYTSYRLRID
jgi:hypothetical protein